MVFISLCFNNVQLACHDFRSNSELNSPTALVVCSYFYAVESPKGDSAGDAELLKGKTGKRYIGITNNLPRRIREHRSKTTKSGQLLGDFFVLYTEEFPDYKAAREREIFLKSGQGRKWLDDLESKSRPARGG